MTCRRGKESGFTLIELMIVVAIMGLLAATAIPNFLRYQAKARQSEARSNLAGIFAAEIAYFGEQSRYGSFGEIGFALAGASNRYVYAGPPNGGSGNAPTACPITDVTSSCFGVGTGPYPGDDPGSTRGGVGGASIGAGAGFTAVAWANLDNDPLLDRWYVTDTKLDLQLVDRDDVNQ